VTGLGLPGPDFGIPNEFIFGLEFDYSTIKASQKDVELFDTSGSKMLWYQGANGPERPTLSDNPP